MKAAEFLYFISEVLEKKARPASEPGQLSKLFITGIERAIDTLSGKLTVGIETCAHKLLTIASLGNAGVSALI